MLGSLSPFMAAGIGILAGTIKSIWQTHVQAKLIKELALLNAAGLVTDRHDARVNGKQFQFTRRIIVISFMLVLLTPIILIFKDPAIIFNVPVPDNSGSTSFLFGLFSKGSHEGIKYVQVQGFAYVVSTMDMMWLIVGFYFGSGGSRVRY